MISDTYLPQVNGVATSIYLSKKYLEMRGHKVYIVAPVRPDDDENILVVPGVPFPMEKQHKVVFANALKILEFAQKNGIEIVHSHDPMALGIRALKLQKDMKIPHVHTYHTLMAEYRHYVPPPFTPDRKTVEEFSKWFCNKVNFVIAPTEEIEKELTRYGVERPIESSQLVSIRWNFRRQRKKILGGCTISQLMQLCSCMREDWQRKKSELFITCSCKVP